MGNPLDFISGLDKSSDMYNEQKELIETLAALAQSKSDSFALQIEKNIAEADTEFNKSLPVEAWISTEKQSHAIATEGATDLISQVAGQVKKFIQQDGQSDDQHTENIIDGIGGLLGSAVDVFLGAGQASDDLLERMCVYMHGFGVERLDFKLWKREIQGSGIKDKVSKVVCFVGVRSAVDLSKVKLNTFLILYGKQLTAMGYKDSELEEAIDAAKRILQKFKMDNSASEDFIDVAKATALIEGS